MSCINCGRGLCFECDQQPCCCSSSKQESPTVGLHLDNVSFTHSEQSINPTIIKRGRPFKDDSEISTSAGRKRAAELYSIDPDKACEWRGKSNCGGGKSPIVGCLTGTQKHRHHGPVKNTSHNERTNIHLICARCHNTWHGVNDPLYDESAYENLPHDPRPMTIDEMLLSGG